jgi:hypothetical protein
MLLSLVVFRLRRPVVRWTAVARHNIIYQLHLCCCICPDQKAEDDIASEDHLDVLPPYLGSTSGWIDAQCYNDH